MLAHPVDHFLIISRPKNEEGAAPSIEFDTIKLSEANDKCQELIKLHPDKTFKVETWTKIR